MTRKLSYDYSHIFRDDPANFRPTVLAMVEDHISYKAIKEWFWGLGFQPNKDQLSFIYEKTHNIAQVGK